MAEFCKRYGQSYEPDELDALMAELEAQQEELSIGVNESGERRMQMRQELEQIRQRISQLSSKAPAWIMAQEALTQLNEQSHETFESSTAVTEFMQQLLEQEREITVERDEVAAQRKDLEKQIERLSQPSGAEDGRMLALAERFNGVLLSEIYDDITIEDAAYFLRYMAQLVMVLWFKTYLWSVASSKHYKIALTMFILSRGSSIVR